MLSKRFLVTNRHSDRMVGRRKTNNCLLFSRHHENWGFMFKAILFMQQILELPKTLICEILGLQVYGAGPRFYTSVSVSQRILFAPDWGWQGCDFNKCAFGSCQRSRNTVVCNLWGLGSSCKHARGSKTHLLKMITKTSTTNYAMPSSWTLHYLSLFLEITRENNRMGNFFSDCNDCLWRQFDKEVFRTLLLST